ncbi:MULTISPECIES: integrase core domain-containing protein [Streptomyces]|uniref:Integrase core domain-containing protein n=2 Tax=Streptomyces TaxID=1883 RepID=A0ABV9J0W0_9ACTN
MSVSSFTLSADTGMPGASENQRHFSSSQERRDAFPQWLHSYNHHRGHTALKGQPPASRVPNLTGQYTSGLVAGSISM